VHPAEESHLHREPPEQEDRERGGERRGVPGTSEARDQLFLSSSPASPPRPAFPRMKPLVRILDGRLASRDHLVGDHFTLVDLIVANGITYATYTGVSTKGHDNVEKWLAHFQERPAYKKAWAMA